MVYRCTMVTLRPEGGKGAEALGRAVLESIVYKDGKVANANMTNCIVPTFADIPELVALAAPRKVEFLDK